MTPLQQATAVIEELVADDDVYVKGACLGLLKGYDARWFQEQLEIELLEVEKTELSKLLNPATGRPSRTHILGMKYDKLVRWRGHKTLVDHKTCDRDIEDPDATYWQLLAVDSQAAHYELVLQGIGVAIATTLWDVTRKPTIRPRRVPNKVREQALTEGVYCGFDLTGDTLDYLQDHDQENAELYGYRVAHDCLENPAKYFQRRMNPRTSDQLREYWEETWQESEDIRTARRTNSHYKNPQACFNWGRPCTFLGVCSGYDSIESDKWRKKDRAHSELPAEVGANALTNSRLKTFRECRRKHYYKYELGVERVQESRSEALFFGTVWHEAQDAWWAAASSLKEVECATGA